MKLGTNHYNILLGKDLRNKSHILKFNNKVRKYIEKITSIKKFNAVMSGNYNYAWQQEIASYCIENQNSWRNC